MDKSIYSPRSLQLAAHLKYLRTQRNLTLKDMAAKIHRGHPYVIDYEAGQRRLDIIQLMEVARALESSLTAITEAVTQEPLPDGEPAAEDPPELADLSDNPETTPTNNADRDAWYQAEWSRLCTLLRSTREHI